MAGDTLLSMSIARLQSTLHQSELDFGLHEIASAFGVKHMTCLVLRARSELPRYPYYCTTYPDDWTRHYIDRQYFEIDPVVDIIRWGHLAVDWRRLERASPVIEHFFREAQINGVGINGMTVPVRGPRGERSLFSVSSELMSAEWEALSADHVHDFHILSHYMHEKLLAVAGLQMRTASRPLSSRERACLEGLASGLLAKQIAADLGISESAVRLYLRGARRKLGASTTYQAIARASLFELIAV